MFSWLQNIIDKFEEWKLGREKEALEEAEQDFEMKLGLRNSKIKLMETETRLVEATTDAVRAKEGK